MYESLSPALDQLLERRTGSLHFQFVVQPIAAGLDPCRAAMRGAETDQPPLLRLVMVQPIERYVGFQMVSHLNIWGGYFPRQRIQAGFVSAYRHDSGTHCHSCT